VLSPVLSRTCGKIAKTRHIHVYWHSKAAEHIFEDHSGAVLLAAATPGLVLKLLYGFGVHTIPYSIRIAVISLVPFSVFFIIAGVESTAIRLSAIAFVSLVGGLGESSFLSLTATYSSKTIGAWSSGTGGAGTEQPKWI